MTLGTRYAAALENALGNEAQVFCYSEDFGKLWSDGFDPGDRAVVIVWDSEEIGTNADDRLLAKHLTPLDWALAWTMKTKTAHRIVIIDGTAGRWQDTWAWTVRHQLLADMPWVTLAAPYVREEDERLYRWMMRPEVMDAGREGTVIEGEGGVIRKGHGRYWTLETGSSRMPDRATLETLNKNWAASLSQSDEHHDINNVVTPLMLLPVEACLDGTPNAMLKRLHWTGLRGSKVQPTVSLLNPDKTSIRIVAVDDRVLQWGVVLEELFRSQGAALGEDSEEAPYEIEIFTDMTPLIKALSPWPEGLHEGIRFASALPETSPDEILFLDLDLKTALESYGPFVAAAKDLDANRSEKLWGKGIRLIPEGRDVVEWLKCRPGSDEWRELLTLPARVIATIDPTLPIIIFASTSRRDVLESLRPFYNIITGFEKPHILGSHRDMVVSSARVRLREVVGQAKDILNVRATLRKLGNRDEPTNGTGPASALLVNQGPNAPPMFVDVFVDEDGDEHITIGALVLFSQPAPSPNYERRYTYTSEIDKIFGRVDQNAENWKNILRTDLLDLDISEKPYFYSMNRISIPAHDEAIANTVINTSISPTSYLPYKLALASLIETIIFHQVLRSDTDISIVLRLHIATLVNKKEHMKESEINNLKRDTWSWGVGQNQRNIFYISANDAMPILSAMVIKYSQYTNCRVSIARARAFGLNENQATVEWENRVIAPHYVVDAVVGKQDFAPIAIHGAYTTTVASLLSAAELGRKKQIGLCLAAYSKVADQVALELNTENFRDNHILNRLRGAIADYLSYATGADLAEATRLIAAGKLH